MPSNQKLGTRKEYKICEDYRKKGYDLVQRSAGSHSEVDIFAIRVKDRKIKLIQSKRTISESMDYINPKLKKKLEEKNKHFNGIFEVEFIAL